MGVVNFCSARTARTGHCRQDAIAVGMGAKHADRNRESVCPFSPSSNSKQILLAGASGLFGRCSPVERVRNTNHSNEELGRGAGLGKGLQPRDAFAE